MARKGKKKANKKPKPDLSTMKGGVAKAIASKKLMRLWEDALLRDEVLQLRQRLEKTQGERESLLKLAAEREAQHEAIFDTLKQKVVDAEGEIHVSQELFCHLCACKIFRQRSCGDACMLPRHAWSVVCSRLVLVRHNNGQEVIVVFFGLIISQERFLSTQRVILLFSNPWEDTKKNALSFP